MALKGLRSPRARARRGPGRSLVFERHGELARTIAIVGLVALIVSYGAPPAKAFASLGPDPLPQLVAPELTYPSFGDGARAETLDEMCGNDQ